MRGWIGLVLGAMLCVGAGALAIGPVAGDPPVAPVSDDPAQEAVVVVAAECGGSGGAFTVEAGFTSPVDLDGDGLDDLILDYGGLRCGGLPPTCGTGGCTQEIWLAEDTGLYRRLLTDLIVRIELPAPGRLRPFRGRDLRGGLRRRGRRPRAAPVVSWTRADARPYCPVRPRTARFDVS